MPGDLIIGDADSLIALVNTEDANHSKAKKIVRRLSQENSKVVYPNTAVLEAITALTRKLNLGDKAELIARQCLEGAISVIWVDDAIQQHALKFFIDNSASKKNTIFDCIVVACLKMTSAKGIFSFDRWYSRLGYHNIY